VAQHLAGNQAAAQHHCERGLALSAEWNCRHIQFFGFDHRVQALTALARVLWLRGLPIRAVRTARQAVDEAMRRGHPVDLASALAHTTPVFLWAGDFEGAADLVDRTIAHTTKHALRHYHSVGLALRGEVTAARGELAVGLDLMREALTAFQAERHNVHATILHGALAGGLARCGEFTDATTRIAGAVEAAERGGLPFNLPDLLRAQAEILLAAPRPDPGAAEAALLRSLEWARSQSALGWELRAAIPLARLWARQGRPGDAQDLLTGVYEQFTEGFETADLKAASAFRRAEAWGGGGAGRLTRRPYPGMSHAGFGKIFTSLRHLAGDGPGSRP
jgi:predicted ATPase